MTLSLDVLWISLASKFLPMNVVTSQTCESDLRAPAEKDLDVCGIVDLPQVYPAT